MPIRVAVDVGGTFTDICILDEATLGASASRRSPRRRPTPWRAS